MLFVLIVKNSNEIGNNHPCGARHLTKKCKRFINESMKSLRWFAFLALVMLLLLPARVEGGV